MKKRIIKFGFITRRVKPTKIIDGRGSAQVLVEDRDYDKKALKNKVEEIIDLCLLHAARPKRRYKKTEEDLEPEYNLHWTELVFKINRLHNTLSSRYAATIVHIEVRLEGGEPIDFDKILGVDICLWSGKK